MFELLLNSCSVRPLVSIELCPAPEYTVEMPVVCGFALESRFSNFSTEARPRRVSKILESLGNGNILQQSCHTMEGGKNDV